MKNMLWHEADTGLYRAVKVVRSTIHDEVGAIVRYALSLGSK
jgi:hypothetical protein